MQASGHTLSTVELRSELREAWAYCPVYVTDGCPDTRIEIRATHLTSLSVELIIDSDALADDKEKECKDLLQRYLDKEVNASKLRALAKELLGD